MHQLQLITDLLGKPPPHVVDAIGNVKARAFLNALEPKVRALVYTYGCVQSCVRISHPARVSSETACVACSDTCAVRCILNSPMLPHAARASDS